MRKKTTLLIQAILIRKVEVVKGLDQTFLEGREEAHLLCQKSQELILTLRLKLLRATLLN